jgi:hypothetical protein
VGSISTWCPCGVPGPFKSYRPGRWLTTDNHNNDRISVSDDGHYVGDDGFVVPRDFDEFYERYPKYVLTWVKRRLNSFVIDDVVEDWAQDMLIHMKWLPAGSKHRLPAANGRELGCADVIETFNPHEEGGASEQVFRKYVSARLAVLFHNLAAKRRAAQPAGKSNDVQEG